MERLILRPWIFISIALAALIILWALSTRHQAHQVKAVFSEAPSVTKGLDVRVDGIDAGKVTSVKHEGGHAVIGIGINDEAEWPLHQGTTATLRFGTTVGNGTRIIDINPGPKSAPKIPEDGIIGNKDTVEATEFDDVFNIFTKKSRGQFQGMLAGTGKTFGPREKQISQGVDRSGPGLDAVGDLARELVSDEPALRSFVAGTDSVTASLAPQSERIKGLITGGAATFDEFARNADGIVNSLDRFPTALRETRTTLSRLDTSVGHLSALTTDIRPGAAQLAPLSRDLRPALADLRVTVPTAVSTFRTARRTAPAVTRLLKDVQPFSKRAAPSFQRLAPMVSCIRPYAPEIMGMMSNWISFTKGFDGTGSHTGRLEGNAGPTSITSTPNVDIPTFLKATGQGYAFVRPPGYNAGQPWYQPQCNNGTRGLDPTQDAENGGKN